MIILNQALLGVVTAKDLEIQKRLCEISIMTLKYFSSAPDILKYTFNCHSISIALGSIEPEVKVIHGNVFGLVWTEKEPKVRQAQIKLCRHSWLLTPDGAILDAYPVGFLALDIVLVPTTGTYAPYLSALYQEDTSVLSEIDMVEVQQNADILVGFIRRAMEVELSEVV
jgi:hypothetical protein